MVAEEVIIEENTPPVETQSVETQPETITEEDAGLV